MLKEIDPYEVYRKELDGKTISGKESGGDYEFKFSRPLNRKGDIQITRLSVSEKFNSSYTLQIVNDKCIMRLNLNDLPDDVKIELEELKENEYSASIDIMEHI